MSTIATTLCELLTVEASTKPLTPAEEDSATAVLLLNQLYQTRLEIIGSPALKAPRMSAAQAGVMHAMTYRLDSLATVLNTYITLHAVKPSSSE